jgi:metal-sulfur cluster biosynthetic enzyme
MDNLSQNNGTGAASNETSQHDAPATGVPAVKAPEAAESDVALMDLENKAREALREVYDPELGMSVIELGLIRKFDWSPGNAEVTMILTTPFCPYGPALIEQVRQKVQETTQRVARVTMGLEMWDPTMMEDQAAANWGLYY